MKGTFKIIIYMDQEYINGLMGEDTKENGKITKWMVIRYWFEKIRKRSVHLVRW
jgi:hypothetical protein